MWTRLRSIILEHNAQKSVDECIEKFPRFQEAWDGLEWVLARTPDKGFRTKVHEIEFRLYSIAGDVLARTPNIDIVYTFNDNEVVVYGIRATELDDENEDI